MTPADFVARLADVSMPDVFNPWADVCADHDLPNAPAVRRRNLLAVLEAAIAARVDAIWIARDLGYRGGRRTGVAMTDEAHLPNAARLYGNVAIGRATRGPVVVERTATVVWRTIEEVGRPVLLWNVFPLHPHEPGRPLTNRCHTRRERLAFGPLLAALLDIVNPATVVAIGRDAQVGLTELGITSAAVRHPSYGGQAEFRQGVLALHGIDASPAQHGFAM
jgi:hypothetical protein